MKKMAAIIFSLTISLNVFAQGNGGITGTVTDDNGARVAGAQVVLTSSTGVHLNTSTDQSGTFESKISVPALISLRPKLSGAGGVRIKF